MNSHTALWGLLYVDIALLAGVAGVFVVGTEHVQAIDSSKVMGTLASVQDFSSTKDSLPVPYKPSSKEIEDTEYTISQYARDAMFFQFVKPNEQHTYTVESNVIKTLYKTIPTQGRLQIVIDTNNLNALISQMADVYNKTSSYEYNGLNYSRPDRTLNEFELKHTFTNELLSRTNGNSHTIFTITPYVDEFPATTGDLADKYLEVDKSQQKLYRGEDGKVIDSHIISTGRIGPTPNGTHRIINHAKNAWSPIANVWTPYWMAFSYNGDAKAWLGFHELPYWDGTNGEKVRRSFDTLGKPVTGGCIQLNIGDAEKVFNWADNNMLVIIHD